MSPEEAEVQGRAMASIPEQFGGEGARWAAAGRRLWFCGKHGLPPDATAAELRAAIYAEWAEIVGGVPLVVVVAMNAHERQWAAMGAPP